MKYGSRSCVAHSVWDGDEGKQHVHRETTEPQNVSRSHIRDLGGRKEESLLEKLGTFSQAR